ncbi:hypothetical protein [Amycolatopsis echigonensis]|uniref:hypothetical protein n=1 Tax=Amycolatopsis echigonensis TaxID=2576905 RepID=UPI001C7ECD2B|nr:hypothetical protein [Amycolatopsis echigonensis]
MNIELQVVPDCPNQTAAVHLLRQALDDVGLATTQFSTVMVTSPEQAEELAFTGSPTIRIDGIDPFTDLAAPPALACRIYHTATGPSGTPELPHLHQALKRAIDRGADPATAGSGPMDADAPLRGDQT